MEITVEISLYPLTSDYGTEVLDFIHQLKKEGSFKIRSNTMSTQVTGEFEEVMAAVTRTMHSTFSRATKAAVVLKCFNEGLDIEWIEP